MGAGDFHVFERLGGCAKIPFLSWYQRLSNEKALKGDGVLRLVALIWSNAGKIAAMSAS